MKLQSNLKSFEEIIEASLDKSIDESYANYGGTNVVGSVVGGSKDKYTPATILVAPPIRHKNPDVTVGQPDFQTKSPSPMIYPFQSVFTELVEIWTRVEEVARVMETGKEMASIDGARKDLVERATKDMFEVKAKLARIIKKIEEVTI